MITGTRSDTIDSRANRFCDWKLLRNWYGGYMSRSLPFRGRSSHIAEQTLFERGGSMNDKRAEFTQGDAHPRGTITEFYTIRFLESGEIYRCGSAETLLQGMTRLGRKGIPAGCLNGGCGVCKVEVSRGCVLKTGAMSRAHVSAQEEMQGVVLACRVAPRSDVELRVVGKMRKAVFVIR